MSKKPYIKIVYPDASPIAMLLTEAMVRRASGKRVVETESTERESTGQDLFAGTLCCVTETSVELTLNLAPEAMDFALATLIAKNLTQAERDKAMAASDSLELDALFTPRAEEPSAPADDPTEGEQKKEIEVGKMEAVELRRIISDLQDDMNNHRGDQIEIAHRAFDAICEAAHMTARDFAVKTDEDEQEIRIAGKNYVACCLASALIAALKCGYKKKDIGEMKSFVDDIIEDILIGNPNDLDEIEIPGRLLKIYLERKDTICLPDDLDDLPGMIKNTDNPSWDDVEKEARTIGQKKPQAPAEKSAAPLTDGDIDPGLLNDIEGQTEGAKE